MVLLKPFQSLIYFEVMYFSSFLWQFSFQSHHIFEYFVMLMTFVSQTSFSLYLHNQWTNFHKLSCTRKPQMRAIYIYARCTKSTTNDWDIRPSVAVKALSANISWTAKWICTIELVLESTYQFVFNDIWYISKQ